VVKNIYEELAAPFFKTKVDNRGSRFLQNAIAQETAWSHNLEDHNLSHYQNNLCAPSLSLIYYVYHTNL
jgi:hypothetical protein